MNTEKVNRVEVIDWYHDKGRAFVFWEKDAKVWSDLQDEGRTLKIFIERS